MAKKSIEWDGPTLLNKEQVAKWARISVRQLDKLINKGEFPPSVSFGDQSKRWSLAELDKWVATKVEAEVAS